jgi:hypothetical protein
MYLLCLADGHFRQIDIVDTDGDQQFPAMTELNVRHGDAFVIVYAIDDIESFHSALRLRNLIVQIKGV